MHSADPRQPELVRALLDPDLYRPRPSEVELRETHISWVFLAGEFAYKVKKPLHLPFLDYSTLERRHEMCREEVRLNRRLAPDYYLGVVGIVRRDGRWQLVPEDAPDAVEHAVEMLRIPEQLTLERIVRTRDVAPAEIDSVAGRMAEFHRDAHEPADPPASVTRLVEALAENHSTLREVGTKQVAGSRLLSAERFTDAFLARWRTRLEERAAAGKVRDGHGDLRAEHVLLTDPVQVYDCVEFDPGLREIDVAADLAFLVMDLARLGSWADAGRLVAGYKAAGGDPGAPPLLAFLAAYRAWVRAKVACLAPAPATPPGELLELGHRFAWRARLPFALFVCGVAASGKSTLASRLAEISGLPHLSADATRKRLAGLEPTERALPEHYTGDFSLRTYRELGADTAEALERFGGAIVDATGRRRTDRDAFRAGLGGSGAPLLFAHCTADDAVLLERARRRDEAGTEHLSDADLEVVRAQLSTFERLDEAPTGSATMIDTEADPDTQLLAVETFLNAWIPEPGSRA